MLLCLAGSCFSPARNGKGWAGPAHARAVGLPSAYTTADSVLAGGGLGLCGLRKVETGAG